MASYGDVLAANLRGFRTRRGISQAVLGQHMAALGHSAWRGQTVTKVERGLRRLTAEEILALAYCLGISMRQLLEPQPDDKLVEFPSGAAIDVLSVRRSLSGANDGAVKWDGPVPMFGGIPPAGSMDEWPGPVTSGFYLPYDPSPESEAARQASRGEDA